MKEFVSNFWNKKKVRNFGQGIVSLIKWIVISVVLGTVIGVIASGFLYAVHFVTEYRLEHSYMVLFLPLGGLLIVFLYKIFKKSDDTGTSQVLASIKEGHTIRLMLAPLILIATIITHAFGGSVGREGAALQFGGSIGNFLARKLRLSDDSVKIITMAGMAGAFSALFGTPLGAAIFAIEVSMVGIMHYAALVPCVFTAYFAHYIAKLLGAQSGRIPHLVEVVPEIYSAASVKVLVFGIVTALVGILFILLMHGTHRLYSKFFKNAYVRAFVGGVIVCVLASAMHTQDYLGLGESVINAAFAGKAFAGAFALKMIFTALTLEAGFKGGEIVPTLFIGATLGSALAHVMELPYGLAAACGMIGLFVAVTNAPIASMVLALEMFGFAGLPFYAIIVAVSYLISGYFSLYATQQITFSKYQLGSHVKGQKD